MILDDEAYQQATVEDPYEQLFLDETTPEPSHFAGDEPSDLSDTESEEKGPKKFHYHVDLEIINDLTPKIWLKRKL